MLPAGTEAVNRVEETKVVTRSTSAKRAIEALDGFGLMKPVPVSTSVKLGVPATAVVGAITVRMGPTVLTVKVSGGAAVPPPGPLVTTVTVNSPGVVSRLLGIVAVRRELLTNAVVSDVPP